MKRIVIYLCLLIWMFGTAHAFMADQNLFVLTGKDALVTERGLYHRAVFHIFVPSTYTNPVYIRIFDADISENHDHWEPGSEVHYRVFGKGNIQREFQSVSESFQTGEPLTELKLGESRYYDDQWRTFAELDLAKGQPESGGVSFQLIIDAAKGKAINKYQIVVSSLEKENKEIDGLRLSSPSLMLYLPPNPTLATQIRLNIPEDAEYLTLFNFDADKHQYGTQLQFENRWNRRVPLSSSIDGKISSTQVELLPEEKGEQGAIVIRNNQQGNYIQLWVMDDQNRYVNLLLPVFLAPDNRLPIPNIQFVPLSDCFSVILDGTRSSDPDADTIQMAWKFPDGASIPGSRIVHNFEKAGSYPVMLEVSDLSGFVANTSRLAQTIHINQPPLARIAGPEKAIPMETIQFDGSGSQDSDGKIIQYIWKFGDGAQGKGATVPHRYARPGKYSVTLTVEDDGKSLCSSAQQTHLIWVNAPPVPNIMLKPMGAADEEIGLDARQSIDSDGYISKYEWDFGDGSRGEGGQIHHQWKKPGTYTVGLTVTDDAGLKNSRAQETAKIIINASPVALAEYPKIVAAQTEFELRGNPSYDSDGKIRQYLWNTGDGTELQGKTVRYQYASPGIYEVSLTVTDDTDTLNNSNTVRFSIRANHPPIPNAGTDRVVDTSQVTFDASGSTDGDDPIIDYLWDFGDGQRARGKTLSHVYAHPGKYIVTLTVTDASATQSAIRSDQAEITVNYPPVADAGKDVVASVGENVTFDGGFSEDPDGSIVAYRWEVADGKVFDQKTITFGYDTPGVYHARLTVTDDVGAQSTDYAVVTVNAPPMADFFPPSRIAPGQTLELDGSCSMDADGKIVRSWWDFGDGSPAGQGLKVKHVYPESGRYTVTLTVQDDSTSILNTNSRTRTVEVNHQPQANIGDDIRTCDQRVGFDASASSDADGDILNYIWDFGDGTIGKGVRVLHRYMGYGIYPVSLTVDDGMNLSNSKSSANLIAYVNAPPIPDIHVNRQSACAGELILFDAGKSVDPEKGILRYIWDLGDGNPVEGVNPVRTYLIGGDYRIRLKVMDNSNLACNMAEAERFIHITDAPIAHAGEDQTVCAKALVNFDASESFGGGRRVKSYEWDFGDGQYGVGLNPTHVYSKEGQYQARLVITVYGESECANIAEDDAIMTVLPAPIAIFDAPDVACVGNPLVFDGANSSSADSQITEYVWDFGDQTSAQGKQASHTFDTAGTYSVTLRITTDSQKCCNTAEFSKSIRINAAPSAKIQITHAGNSPVMGDSFETHVNNILRFSASQSDDPDGTIQAYVWDFGDGKSADVPFVTHQYDTPGEYTARLTVNDDSNAECSIGESSMQIRVRELGIAEIIGPAKVCAGKPVQYRIQNAGEKPVQWHFGDGTETTGEAVTKMFESPGTYQVQAMSESILTQAVLDVAVLKLPEIALPATVEAFPGDSIEIKPVYAKSVSLPLTFRWNMGEDTILTTEIARHKYTKAGVYEAELVVSTEDAPDGLIANYPVRVEIHPLPDIEIQVPEQLFSGGARDEILFQAISPTGQKNWNYAWDFGDRNQAMGQAVRHAYKKEGKFKITLTLSDAHHRTTQTFVMVKTIEVRARK